MSPKHLIIGLIIGLAASAIGLVLALLFFGTGHSIMNSLNIAINQGIFTKLMSMGAILNLAAFFLLLQRHEDEKAKGVLIATIIVALITVIIRFF